MQKTAKTYQNCRLGRIADDTEDEKPIVKARKEALATIERRKTEKGEKWSRDALTLEHPSMDVINTTG